MLRVFLRDAEAVYRTCRTAARGVASWHLTTTAWI